jgi:hypothetical protein
MSRVRWHPRGLCDVVICRGFRWAPACPHPLQVAGSGHPHGLHGDDRSRVFSGTRAGLFSLPPSMRGLITVAGSGHPRGLQTVVVDGRGFRGHPRGLQTVVVEDVAGSAAPARPLSHTATMSRVSGHPRGLRLPSGCHDVAGSGHPRGLRDSRRDVEGFGAPARPLLTGAPWSRIRGTRAAFTWPTWIGHQSSQLPWQVAGFKGHPRGLHGWLLAVAGFGGHPRGLYPHSHSCVAGLGAPARPLAPAAVVAGSGRPRGLCCWSPRRGFPGAPARPFAGRSPSRGFRAPARPSLTWLAGTVWPFLHRGHLAARRGEPRPS